jgi:hypothetical protein
MQLTVILSGNVHQRAIAKARDVGYVALPDDVLNAIEDAATAGVVQRIWTNVEQALLNAYNQGMGTAREYVQRVGEQLKSLAETAGAQVEAVRQAITARIGVYLKDVIDQALESVRPSIVVGGSTLAVTSVSIDQKIKLSGALKASLESICEFIAEGEISLSAEYAAK